VIGEDEYIDLKDGKWHHSEDILNSFEIKVIQRNDGVSSSKVRELFKNKMFLTAMKYLTPATIKLLPEYKNGIKYS
jgi:nicotinic acid mononucleotide adenylyltransferase